MAFLSIYVYVWVLWYSLLLDEICSLVEKHNLTLYHNSLSMNDCAASA